MTCQTCWATDVLRHLHGCLGDHEVLICQPWHECWSPSGQVPMGSPAWHTGQHLCQLAQSYCRAEKVVADEQQPYPVSLTQHQMQCFKSSPWADRSADKGDWISMDYCASQKPSLYWCWSDYQDGQSCKKSMPPNLPTQVLVIWKRSVLSLTKRSWMMWVILLTSSVIAPTS